MKLLYYTRRPMAENIYAPKLADSVHFAFVEDGQCTPLLHNSGIVYARPSPAASTACCMPIPCATRG